jgi:hypothetical protein
MICKALKLAVQELKAFPSIRKERHTLQSMSLHGMGKFYLHSSWAKMIMAGEQQRCIFKGASLETIFVPPIAQCITIPVISIQ